MRSEDHIFAPMHSRTIAGIVAMAMAFASGCTRLETVTETPLPEPLPSAQNSPSPHPLRSALTFYAPFDETPSAIFARGDTNIYSAPSMRVRESAAPGLPMNQITRMAPGEGKFGGALRFTSQQAPFVFFRAAGNIHYATQDWSGTVSFWLNTDPTNDLEPGFCDPIQITSRTWNDAAFFVEFEKRETIPFRLGVYPDLAVWNPTRRDWNSIPAAEKPLITVTNPPFARGKWTHVLFTWQHFNTAQSNGVARLYLDGELRGEISPRVQTFTWNQPQTPIGLGLNYIGLMDELAAFNRALSADEVRQLHALPDGVRLLLR